MRYCLGFLLCLSLAAQAPVARPKVLGVAHYSIFVSDLAKARAFYEDFLGYEEAFTLPKADGTVQKPFQASVLLGVLKPLVEMAVRERGSAAPLPSVLAKRPTPKAPKSPAVVLIDPERVQAAVTLALDASLSGMIDEITEKVLIALSTR